MKTSDNNDTWLESFDNLPSSVSHWLDYNQSITAKIRALEPNTFTFHLESQQTSLPTAFDQKILSLNKDQKVVIRKINMAHNGERCLFGKTIIPLSLCHAEPRFATLDDAPIGPVLFDVLKQPPIMRRFATLTPDDTFYQSATRKTTNKSESLYARFTVYPFTQGNLLIYEVFFPVLFEANNSNEK